MWAEPKPGADGHPNIKLRPTSLYNRRCFTAYSRKLKQDSKHLRQNYLSQQQHDVSKITSLTKAFEPNLRSSLSAWSPQDRSPRSEQHATSSPSHSPGSNSTRQVSVLVWAQWRRYWEGQASMATEIKHRLGVLEPGIEDTKYGRHPTPHQVLGVLRHESKTETGSRFHTQLMQAMILENITQSAIHVNAGCKHKITQVSF